MNGILELVRNPPYWFLAIILAVLVSHLLKIGLKLPDGSLIPIMEFLVVVVIAGVTADVFLQPTVIGETKPSDNRAFYIIALGSFTLLSIILYLIDKQSPHK